MHCDTDDRFLTEEDPSETRMTVCRNRSARSADIGGVRSTDGVRRQAHRSAVSGPTFVGGVHELGLSLLSSMLVEVEGVNDRLRVLLLLLFGDLRALQ